MGWLQSNPVGNEGPATDADTLYGGSGNDILRPMLIQLAKRLPRHEPRWKEFRESLRKTKGANVVSAAIANRWLRRLYHELVPKRHGEEGPPETPRPETKQQAS